MNAGRGAARPSGLPAGGGSRRSAVGSAAVLPFFGVARRPAGPADVSRRPTSRRPIRGW